MLTECPECNHRISDQARTCPQCGFPIVGSGDPVRDAVIRILKGERIFLAITAAGSALWWLVSLVARHRSSETALYVMALSILGLVIIPLILAARQRK